MLTENKQGLCCLLRFGVLCQQSWQRLKQEQGVLSKDGRRAEPDGLHYLSAREFNMV